GELKAKLVRRSVPRGDGHSRQPKGIRSRRSDPAEARAAATKPGRLHQIPGLSGQVVPPPIRIRKQIDAIAEPLLHLQSGACNFVSPDRRFNGPEIDVRTCVRADVESLPPERSDLVPRHPRM